MLGVGPDCCCGVKFCVVVKSCSGAPIIGASVTVAENGVTDATGTTDAAGRYCPDVPAGRATVTVTTRQGQTRTLAVTVAAGGIVTVIFIDQLTGISSFPRAFPCGGAAPTVTWTWKQNGATVGTGSGGGTVIVRPTADVQPNVPMTVTATLAGRTQTATFTPGGVGCPAQTFFWQIQVLVGACCSSFACFQGAFAAQGVGVAVTATGGGSGSGTIDANGTACLGLSVPLIPGDTVTVAFTGGSAGLADRTIVAVWNPVTNPTSLWSFVSNTPALTDPNDCPNCAGGFGIHPPFGFTLDFVEILEHDGSHRPVFGCCAAPTTLNYHDPVVTCILTWNGLVWHGTTTIHDTGGNLLNVTVQFLGTGKVNLTFASGGGSAGIGFAGPGNQGISAASCAPFLWTDTEFVTDFTAVAGWGYPDGNDTPPQPTTVTITP